MLDRSIGMLDRNYRFLALFASVGLMLVASGSMFLLAVALKPIAQDFAWPRTVPSVAYSLLYIGAGIGGIMMGHWMDRSGMGRPALVGALMMGTGAMLTSAITSQWQLFAVFGLMMGLFGHGALFSPLLTNIIRWFDHHRGTAVGIVSGGQSLAGVFWPPVFRYFVETIGWRGTFMWYGVFALAVMVPLSLVMRRQPPGRTRGVSPRQRYAGDAPPGGHGGCPPGNDMRGTPPRPPGAEAPASAIPGLSPGALLVVLSVAGVCCCIAMALPLAHIVAHVSDIGHPTARAAEMLSAALAGSFLSRVFLLGPIANRFGGFVTLFAFSLIQALGIGLLVFVDGLAGLYLAAAVFGFGYGGIVPSYPVIVREYMPAHQGGRRTATVISFAAIGMAIGGWLGGFVHDLTGSYGPAFGIGVAFNVCNLAIAGTLIYRARAG